MALTQAKQTVTAILSGPLAGRQPLLAQLERVGLDVSEQPKVPNWGFDTDRTEGWITVLAPELADVEAIVANAGGWRLRAHHNTPVCRACNGRVDVPCLHCEGKVFTNVKPKVVDPMKVIADLTKRIEQLEKK